LKPTKPVFKNQRQTWKYSRLEETDKMKLPPSFTCFKKHLPKLPPQRTAHKKIFTNPEINQIGLSSLGFELPDFA